jgi:hypothetical protein
LPNGNINKCWIEKERKPITLPIYLANGFNFEEAISLVELCQRAQQVLAHAAGDDAKDLYNLLFKDDEWVCVHATEAKAQAQAPVLFVHPIRERSHRCQSLNC